MYEKALSTMSFTGYISSLSENPYFGAGFGLFGVGAGAALLRSAFKGATLLFRRNYMMTLEVPCRDKSYQWLLQWITEKAAKHTQHLSVETSFQQKDTGSVKTKYEFIPSVGTHFFRYGGNWIKVERKREQHTLDLHLGVPWETVTLTAFGRDKTLYYDILEEARHMALRKLENRTMLYTAFGSEWRPFGDPRKRRPLHSVVLDVGIKEKILQDCLDFINNPGWYTDRGIPYRRGYLLHGPPGCGKSSFISALAGELHFGICILNLSERGLSDDRLNYLLAVAPQNTIILLEDIDAAFLSREEYSEGKNPYEGLTRVSFSGLLNCLDGVASAEGRVLFMTTNYIERLDPALIRPGRVDVKEYIGHCTAYQVEQMFLRFYPELAQYSKEFTEKIMSSNKKLSPAQLQGYFMIYKSCGEAVLNEVEKIWESRGMHLRIPASTGWLSGLWGTRRTPLPTKSLEWPSCPPLGGPRNLLDAAFSRFFAKWALKQFYLNKKKRM